MIMNHTAPNTLLRSSMLIVLALACNDQRLRDLGYTLGDVPTPPPTDPVEIVPGDCESLQPPSELVSADAITRAVAADVARADSADRPFLRYATLADLLNAGVCSDTLRQTQLALDKLINGVSNQGAIVLPAAVDGGDQPTLFRIDLRDYGLDRAIDLDGESHRDGWEALIATSPYAIALDGEAGSELADQTGTASPWLSVTAIVNAAADGELYYALAGIPSTLGELREKVGLSAELDPFQDGVPRAATSRSRVLRAQGNLRAVDRYSTPDGSYYEALQIESTALLADPLHVQPDVQRLIAYDLPNGLLAFAVVDGEGNRQTVGEGLLDTNRDDFTGTVSVSCSNCHAQGLIPVDDEIRAAVLDNQDLFSAEVVSAYAQGPDGEERAAIFQADSDRFAEALEAVGLSGGGSDPISSAFFRSAQQLEAASAAAELLVTPETLRARLSDLPAALLPLGVGLLVSRAQFDGAYAAAFCTLHADDENPPAAATCE